MASRSIPEVVLEEAAEVLGALGDWLRLAPHCPSCLAVWGCSHDARCPLDRVRRLRCLLGSGDEKRRDEELNALRRERGATTPAEDGALTARLRSTVAVVPVEPGAPPAGDGGAT
jgi:hypothetical protein